MRARIVVMSGFLALAIQAHEGPEHEIEELSRRMVAVGETADLLLERAIEFRSLGRWTEAAEDLLRASRLAPSDPLLSRELAQVQLRLGRSDEAMSTLRRALRLKGLEGPEKAALLMIRCEAHSAGRSWERALSDCDEALRSDPSLVSAYLERSSLQRRLGRHGRRLSGLEEGLRRTGAGILVAERVDALLDASRWIPALEAAEAELNSSRLEGTWRIRRARALLGLGRRHEAGQDLKAAIAEIDRRMPSGRPEVSLLLERALARELSGEIEAALADYTMAAESGAGVAAEEALRRLRDGGAPRRPSTAVAPAGKLTTRPVARSLPQ